VVGNQQGSANIARWGGLAAMLGGGFWISKGGLIMLGGPDPDLLIPGELFLALGLVGLHAQLGGRGGWPGRIGSLLAYAAVVLSAVNAPYSLLFAEDGPRTPFPFNVAYFAASVAIFAGLISLGIAGLRAKILTPRWRVLPPVLGLASILPVWVLAFVHLELPVVFLGLGWVAFGYALWADGKRRTVPAPR
jgi:hypothetical protein